MKKVLNLKEKRRIFRIVNRKLKEIFPKIKIALNFSNPWELLVATILSAQTTDKKVNEITERLFKKYKKIEDYANADLKEFMKDIKGVNYYQQKAKAIIENAKVILKKFNGQVPKNISDLLQLKFVGRKTANIVLANAYGILEGIPVDTHVKRLSRMLGLTIHKDPIKIEKDLMEIVPKSEWKDFPLRLIEYGRTYCPAKPHDHKNCPLTILLKNIDK